MDCTFWAEVVLTVFTGLHDCYGKCRQWKACLASLFGHSLNTVELCELIVGGSLKWKSIFKILPFYMTKHWLSMHVLFSSLCHSEPIWSPNKSVLASNLVVYPKNTTGHKKQTDKSQLRLKPKVYWDNIFIWQLQNKIENIWYQDKIHFSTVI